MGLFDQIKNMVAPKPAAAVPETKIAAPVTFPETPPTSNELVNQSLRPFFDLRYNAADIGQYPLFWAKYNELYQFAESSDILGIIFDARKRQIFRRGIANKQKQGTETTGLPTFEEEPPSQISKAWEDAKDVKIESFIKQANANGQTMRSVLKEIEEDECTVDEGYLVCQFVYEVDESGTIISKSAKEFFRQDPRCMRIIADRRNRMGRTTDGHKVWFSVHDRTKSIKDDEAKKMKYVDAKGVKLFPAHFRFDAAAVPGGTGQVFYAPWEVCHASEWNETLTYSKCPPLLRVWMKVWTLVKMDEYVMKNYALQRPPKFFLVFNTTNALSLDKEYNKMIQRAQMDPHTPQILANESKESSGGVQMVDLMRPLEEMQFIEVRQEYRQQIGATWGVMPIWHADTSTSGGLNNEGMQITVTNRAVEDSQTFYNETFLSFITRSIGIADRVLELNPSEELDQVAELQQQAMKIQNASAMRALGLEVHFDEKTGEFSYRGQVAPQPPPTPFGGGFGGEPGGDEFGAGPSTGFDSAPGPQFSGTTDDEVAQSDPKGFRYPVLDGDTKQADTPADRAKRLGLALSDKLLQEFDPVLRKLEKLAKKDPQAARREVARLARLLSGKVKDQADKTLRRTYVEGQKDIEEQFKFKPVFTGKDEQVVNSLLSNQLYADAVKGLRTNIEQAAYQTIAESISEKGTYNLETVREAIRAIGDVAEKDVKTLARTNSHLFFAAGRRSGYVRAEQEIGEKFLYAWLGPSDHRTTPVCERIKARVDSRGGAVPYEELVAIVTEESRKDYPTFTVVPEALQAHWNERHLAVRRVRA